MNLLRNKKLLLGLGLGAALILLLVFKKPLSSWLGGYSTTASGLEYRFLKGARLTKNLGPGNHMLFNYLLIGPDKDTVTNSYNSDTLMEMDYPVEAHNELMEALQITGAGSTIEVRVSTDSLKKKIPKHPKILMMKENDWAKFVVSVEKVLNDEDFAAYINQKRLTRMMAENSLVDQYCSRHKANWVLDSVRHFKYCITTPKNTDRFKDGDEVEYDVTVHTISGVLVLDSRQEGRRYTALLGKPAFFLPALDVLPYYLGEGESADFVTTSELGFGARGRIGVPGYAPLVIQIKNIQKINKK
ncbi:MAG: hypothetical protein JNL57_07400 [Bacteroidetes bacterium]|nr:hypothetical protein [Bacteroidota bacterium]